MLLLSLTAFQLSSKIEDNLVLGDTDEFNGKPELSTLSFSGASPHLVFYYCDPLGVRRWQFSLHSVMGFNRPVFGVTP